VTFLIVVEDKHQVCRHQNYIHHRTISDNTVIQDNHSSDDIDDIFPFLPHLNDTVVTQPVVPLRRFT